MDKELAWAAAFLESEGSVGLRRDDGHLPHVILQVGNGELAMIERFMAAVGGHGRIFKKKPTEMSTMQHYGWNCSSRKAEAILEMLLPYMTPDTKKYQRAQKYLKHMRARPRLTGRNGNNCQVGPELGRVSDFSTITELRQRVVQSMIFGTLENRAIDYVANIDVIRYANVLTAESMEYEFDVGRQLWLNRSRWTRLCRQYLDVSEVASFLQRAADIGLGEGKRGVITNMHCRNVARENKKHRWGGCCSMFTYRGVRNGKSNNRPTVSMHGRVSYVGYMGALDLALAYVLAKEISKRIEVPVEEFRFEWHLGSAQLHAFKSLPMLYSDGWMPYFEQEKMRQRYPAIKLIGKWHDQIVNSTESGQPLDEIKYGPLRRVTRRYREFIDEDYLPQVMVDSLDLSPLTRV